MSPDGKLTAVLMDDRGGGAMTSAYQEVEIRGGQDSKVVFVGENMGGRSTPEMLFGPLNVSWVNSHSLLIEFCSGDVLRYLPEARVNGRRVAINFAREEEGQWPASVPLDRRMGTPCNARNEP